MKLIKNYLYNIGYQIFILIIPLVTVPYIARVLGAEGVGINAFTNSIIQYFILFGSIGVNLYGNRTIAYNRDNKEKLSQSFWEITFLRFICIFVSYVCFLIFLGLVSNFKVYYFYQSLLIIAAAFDISWFFMGIEDFKKTVLRNILVKLLSLAAIFAFVRTSHDTAAYILILSLSTLLGNLTLWPYIRKMVYPPNFKEMNLRVHLSPSISLFIPQIATQVYLVLNKTMLGLVTGVESSGYYENTDKIVKIVLAVVTATGTVMLPRVANTFARGQKDEVKRYLYTSFDFVSAICFPMSLGLAAIAPKFSIWFLTEDFAIVGKLLPILSLIVIFIGWSNVLGTQYLLPTNQTKYFTISVVSGAFVNLLLNFIMINLWGVYGAVVATVLSEIIVTLVQLYYVRYTLNIAYLFKGTWKYVLASTAMMFMVRFMNDIMPGKAFYFMIQVFLGIVIYVLLVVILRAPIIQEAKKMLKKI
ncbi:flippase [Streptococcaceae bacterium ESL0729]|nr:flippase [Streptococcaceae bacterium ESL0729]